MAFSIRSPDDGVSLDALPGDMILRRVSWDDHGHRLLFHLSRHGEDGREREIGLLKILNTKAPRAELNASFERLDDHWCSMGQGPAFYDSLDAQEDARELLLALRDLTVLGDAEREALASNADVQKTLLRTSSARFAYERETRPLASDIQFRISLQVKGFAERHEVHFHFSRERALGRMVVLVGENGTGKSQLLNGLIYPTLGIYDPKLADIDVVPAISRVIFLSFGAFDRGRIPRSVGRYSVISYDYCGLRHYANSMRGEAIVDMQFALRRLSEAHDALTERRRGDLWRRCVSEHGMRPPERGYLEAWVEERSAGQKFICFVLTHLLAKLEPGALVVFDEPETHTHPKMLSLLMRQLDEMLEDHDAFAIVATHSPIVLQELPARQVRVLRTEGEGRSLPLVLDYPRECFAEALDEIVKVGFGLDLEDTNYMRRLREMVRENPEGIEELLAQGGLSARLALALARKRERQQEERGGEGDA
ncbi:ATP-binding protein [Pseudenhygromyxa sp. WMMC2535]|uniref:AAA family ATPase n=1 Tax=Pseudenhygromyxa sp. WMMC2535 TaxID=2712867 RepID=UPI001557D9A4|nr:AAA family ATPase [Pseudenhygromyxa sp. WMMC2535]NVB37217.1 ATP-binding protein [Pseudenhygromyxa sp. WMMC2535]